MNCDEFRNKVADLFDTTIDMQTKAECNQHMAECAECKSYYEELAETFHALQPQPVVSKQKTTVKRHFIWRPVAAAAIFLLGVVIGWNHFFSTPAVADDTRVVYLEQGIRSVQNVGSFKMTVFARTLPNENFSYFDPKADFVGIDIALMRQNDSVYYRVEKQGGRSIVCDGASQFMWIPNDLYVKGSRSVNFLENFVNLLYPERLLSMQISAIYFSEKNEVIRAETDSTITITFKGTDKNSDLQQLLETGQMGDCEVEVENVFSKNDGLLRFVKLWLVDKGKKTLLLYIDNIQYNIMMSRASLVQVPDAQWVDCAEQMMKMTENRLRQLQNETAAQAAQRIIQAIICGDASDASEALIYYKNNLADLIKQMKGCRATNFQERRDKSYAGTYVFYTLTYPNGKTVDRHIAVRNDNDKHIWIADGGL